MTPPSRVLMVTPRWARDGGVGAHVQASARALAQSGVEVSVLVARVAPDEPAEGVRLHHSPRLFDHSAPIADRLGDALTSRPQLVHLNQLDDPGVVDYLRERAAVVISSHGYLACTSGVHYFRPGQECTRAHGAGCVPRLLVPGCAHRRKLWTLPASYGQATRALAALRRADLAISYSQVMDAHLASNGLPRRRVVPYFPTLAPRAGTPVARRRIVFAGRVVTEKGIGTLVRAAREVQAQFAICGDGWQLAAMRRLARRLRVSERMDFRGWLGPDGLAEEFARAAVVVVPSLWPEPFGIVGIEAFAAGRPVVASATGGITEWLADGVSGLAVKPGDARALARALNELLADPERQDAMGAAGREMMAGRYCSERHVATLSDAYAAALAQWESAGAPAPVS